MLKHDIASGSDITPCNKTNKPLVVYKFSIVTYYCIKSHVARLNSHVLTGKPMYYSGNSRPVAARLFYFTYTHSRLLQKIRSSTVSA